MPDNTLSYARRTLERPFKVEEEEEEEDSYYRSEVKFRWKFLVENSV